MIVYLLVHDDGAYDDHEYELRGVFVSEDDAVASLETKTPNGEKSKAWGAHDEWCCSVEEREILGAPQIDVRENPPPWRGGPGASVVRMDWLDEAIADLLRNPPHLLGGKK